MHTVKPLDSDAVLYAAQKARAIVTIEEHSIIGGLGGAVAEVLAECGQPVLFKRIGLRDDFCHQVGSQEHLREIYSLSVPAIVKGVQSLGFGGMVRYSTGRGVNGL